jgi:exosortase/archaeosortase family protein
LNSIYSLSALGLLYLYLMRYRNWLRVGVLLASIVPVAFLANIVRVLILVLVTFHMGDEAGQGFLHGFAGIVLFIVALGLFFGLDKLLELLSPFREPRQPAPAGGEG